MEFRRSLAASFLFRFFLLTSYKLAADADTFKAAFPDTYKSAVKVRSGALPSHRPFGCPACAWWGQQSCLLGSLIALMRAVV